MVRLPMWQFPLSVIIAAIFFTATAFLSYRFRDSRLFRTLSNWKCTVVVICATAFLMTIEGIWGMPLHHTFPFMLLVLSMMAALGLNILGHKGGSLSFKLSHLGFLIAISAAFFGSPDLMKGHMQLWPMKAENICLKNDGGLVDLGFEVRLKKFTIDFYEDGSSPKQYTSLLEIDGKEMECSVNHPCRHKGYSFYQSGYDTEKGEYSVIQVVKDPWYPFVVIGLLMLVAGSISGLGRQFRPGRLVPACIILAGVFTVISVARISFGTLVPALRSLWFIPHLIIYMLAYSTLAVSLICLTAGLVRKVCGVEKFGMIFLNIASTLMLVGMTCGALWAKQAWGDWWTWDPKECWAGVTWLLTLAGTHFMSDGESRKKSIFLFVMLAFIAMQITWYGVKWLPSAAESIHTYK